jgi:hypothetical protein
LLGFVRKSSSFESYILRRYCATDRRLSLELHTLLLLESVTYLKQSRVAIAKLSEAHLSSHPAPTLRLILSRNIHHLDCLVTATSLRWQQNEEDWTQILIKKIVILVVVKYVQLKVHRSSKLLVLLHHCRRSVATRLA